MDCRSNKSFYIKINALSQTHVRPNQIVGHPYPTAHLLFRRPFQANNRANIPSYTADSFGISSSRTFSLIWWMVALDGPNSMSSFAMALMKRPSEVAAGGGQFRSLTPQVFGNGCACHVGQFARLGQEGLPRTRPTANRIARRVCPKWRERVVSALLRWTRWRSGN